MLKLDPPEPVKEEALYRRAVVLRRMGKPDQSLSALDQAIDSASRSDLAVRSRMAKAEILDHELRRSQDALAAYQDVDRQLQGSQGPGRNEQLRDSVRLAMADCELRLERPAEATRLYQAVADSGSDPQCRADALFQAAEMLFYQGKLKEANEAYFQLTDKYPDQKWTNDALARILLLGEKTDDSGIPVTALAQAEYQRRLGKLDTAFKLVDGALSQYPQSRAADALLAERVKLFLDLGKLPEAQVAADTLAARYPRSLLAPRALLQIADEWMRQPQGEKPAQAVLMEILTRFPDALEAADARAALQKLKEGNRDSSLLLVAPVEKQG